MIEPPVTVSPPKRLTPSRWAFESRAFLEDPSPFLCATDVPLSRDYPRCKILVKQVLRCAEDDKSKNYLASALKLLPPTRISLILTSTKLWRWPCIFLYCFLRLKWKTRILSPRPSETTEARTLAPPRACSNFPPSPDTATTSENSMLPS